MACNNNSAFIDFCIAVIHWLKYKTIATHNHYVHFKEDDYATGVAFAYYKAYVLLQQQASVFLIPLKIIGLSGIKEKDLLAGSPIKQERSPAITSIPKQYKQKIVYWMPDQVYEIKEEWLRSKQLLEKEMTSTKKMSESDLKFYEGEMYGLSEILAYMCEQANAHGVPLASLHLDDLDLKTLKR